MDIASLVTFDSILFQVLMALFLGLFIGLRREIDLQKEGSESFVGFRTMPLIVLLGTLSTFFPSLPYLPIVCLIGLLVFLGIAYFNGVFELHLIGLTSEFSTIIMFLAGVLIGSGEYILAILLTVIIAVLTGFKSELHTFAKGVSVAEWGGALQLLILSAVVLPFLPRTAIDPWGVVVPFEVWLLVIFIAGIGFIGYFLNKYFGSKKSVLVTSVLGSLVSSTAVTIALGSQAKEKPHVSKNLFILALLFAIGTMLVRTMITLSVIAGPGVREVIWAPGLMLVATTVCILYVWFTQKKEDTNSLDLSPKINSPFRLLPAVKFAGLFIVILIAVALSQEYIGGLGVLAIAVISALIDVDASILSALQAQKADEISILIAHTAIMLAIVINTAVKLFYVALVSRRDLAMSFTLYIGIICLSGIGGYMFLL